MNTSHIDYLAIGQRLRAYRIAASLRAEDVAENLKISRAAVYRLEKGELVKIETLDRLATLLNTSLTSLLGVDTEYYSSGDGFFERMRQLEEQSTTVYSHFDPFSFLLTSDNYLQHLSMMLMESSSLTVTEKHKIDSALAILRERKAHFQQHSPQVINLVGIQHIERFLHLGLVGSLNLSPSKKMERTLLARQEVLHLIQQIEENPKTLKIAITKNVVPSLTFQIFYREATPLSLAISPFRLGEFPNVSTGIASITSSMDAIRRYQKLFDQLWENSVENSKAIDLLKETLERY
ncbi:helix-turn-helix domain-containing protein [Zophobihabitans entericus]|uniref:Helix-turn-helix domain-containing protein n=1 Tax=Zophobihabitans entericus TaxID=1635327 RepID=A0A6G9IC57_9GAMM|nr:helix-turn-helix transcriptional regulator [Zophobihabitans entericus]QIQ21816.1 helix-turn-helix domain-containing protein [Zophobihabitans entericus]